MEKFFASVRSPLETSVAVARTSQSPFPLSAMRLKSDAQMKIGDITIKNLPRPRTGNVILNKIIEFFVLPIFLIILILILLPILLIFGFIKSIFQKNKIHSESKNNHILLENEKFKITSKYVYLDGDDEIEKVANKFIEKVSDYGDEFGIIQFISEKGETMLDYYPYTLFKLN